MRALALALLTATALAQSPLPKNYKTILDNHDLLVMRVHYGPHEFVPMHDHSAYPTVFVYLNDSGPVRIDHAPPVAFSVTRPPTHTGAFRIAPGMIERHSITNLSDLPSDFLRVELKTIPPTDLKEVTRGEVPSPLCPARTSNSRTGPRSRPHRLPVRRRLQATPTPARSLLIAITDLKLDSSAGKHSLPAGEVAGFPQTRKSPRS